MRSISQDLNEQIIEGIIECCCFSLLTDEGVDKTMTKAADIYVKYLDKNFNEVVAFFLLVPVLCNATSDNILRIIDESFCGAGFPEWKDYLVGMGCDGAAVNTGVRRGIGTQLKQTRPYIIVFHCAAHRLELVVKDCFRDHEEYKQLHSLLSSLNKFYYWFPLNWLGLKAAAEMKTRQATMPPKVDGTRWIAYILIAVYLL